MPTMIYTPELVREVLLRVVGVIITTSSFMLVEGVISCINEDQLRLCFLVWGQVLSVHILSRIAILPAVIDLLEIELLNLVFLCGLLFSFQFSGSIYKLLYAVKDTFCIWMLLLNFVRILWIGKSINGISYAYWPPFGLQGFTSKRGANERASRKSDWLVWSMILGLGVLSYFLSFLPLRFFQLVSGIAGLTLGGFLGYAYCNGLIQTLNQGLENEQALNVAKQSLAVLKMSYSDLEEEFTAYVAKHPIITKDDARAFLIAQAGKKGLAFLEQMMNEDPALVTVTLNALVEVAKGIVAKKAGESKARPSHLSLVKPDYNDPSLP